MMRIGQGYDAHRFSEGRKLILGGVEIPHHQGLLGHSDADVLIHAICDALLGAAGLGDIGQHFPDNQAEFKDIDSRVLLRHVISLLAEQYFKVVNVDATIVAQRPKLASYLPTMQAIIADDMQIQTNCINIKATTTEGMGFVGREEGIAAYAVVLIETSTHKI